jgi:hypothetical protein
MALAAVLHVTEESLDERYKVDRNEDSVTDGDLSAVSAVSVKPCKLVRFFGIFGLLPA